MEIYGNENRKNEFIDYYEKMYDELEEIIESLNIKNYWYFGGSEPDRVIYTPTSVEYSRSSIINFSCHPLLVCECEEKTVFLFKVDFVCIWPPKKEPMYYIASVEYYGVHYE